MSRANRMKRAARLADKKALAPAAHWSAADWRKNADDLVRAPKHPQAYPATYPMDLMGRIRVKLTAEDGDLVAYGFGGQRIVLPHTSIGAVRTVGRFRIGQGNITRDHALLILDRNRKVLLRADGLWETYGEVQRVCQAAKLPSPTHIFTVSYFKPGKYQSRPTRRQHAVMSAPRFEKAPQYRRDTDAGAASVRAVPPFAVASAPVPAGKGLRRGPGCVEWADEQRGRRTGGQPAN